MVIVWGDGHVNKTYFNDSYTISTCIKSFSLGYLKFTQRMYPLNWSKKIGSTETVGLEWVNKTFQARVFNFTIYLNYLGINQYIFLFIYITLSLDHSGMT